MFGSAEKLEGELLQTPCCREFDLAAPNLRDQRSLKILVDGLPLFGGAQLAVDTTLVSPPLIHARQMRMVLF